MPKITTNVRNISLTSPCLRIHLRPLLATPPFVEKATLSFASKPHFDFDLEGSGTFNYLNLGNLIRHVIHDQLEETVVMPNSFTLTLAQRSISDSLDESERLLSNGVPQVWPLTQFFLCFLFVKNH